MQEVRLTMEPSLLAIFLPVKNVKKMIGFKMKSITLDAKRSLSQKIRWGIG